MVSTSNYIHKGVQWTQESSRVWQFLLVALEAQTIHPIDAT